MAKWVNTIWRLNADLTVPKLLWSTSCVIFRRACSTYFEFGNAIYYHRHQSHYHILPLGTTHYHLRKKKFVVVKCPRNWPFFDIPQGTTGVLFMVPELTTTGFEAWGRSTFSRFLIVTWPKYGSTCVCIQSWCTKWLYFHKSDTVTDVNIEVPQTGFL